jgi:hypothetical protein
VYERVILLPTLFQRSLPQWTRRWGSKIIANFINIAYSFGIFQPLWVLVSMFGSRAVTNNTMNCECPLLPACSSSKTRIWFIRFVGEAAALILRSTPIKG